MVLWSRSCRCLLSWRRPPLSHSSRNLMEALCAHLPQAPCCAACRTRLCRMRNICCSLSGQMIWRSIIRFAGIPLADHRRSVATDWNYGTLSFSTENPAIPYRRLALVPGNIGSRYRTRSGWRANHGGPLLLYSFDRFVHCAGVRISGHREERRVAPLLSAGIAVAVLLVLATLTNAQIHAGVTASLCLSTRSQSPHQISTSNTIWASPSARAADTMRPRRILRRHSKSTRISTTGWLPWVSLVFTKAGCRKPSSIPERQFVYSQTRRKRTSSWPSHCRTRTATKPRLKKSAARPDCTQRRRHSE